MSLNRLNVPECYEDYITFREGCNTTPPKSGLYLEGLEGISLKRAANIADSGYKQGVLMAEDKVIHALQVLESVVAGKLMLLQTFLPPAPPALEFCTFNDNLNGVAVEDRGLQIYQNNLLSPFSSFFIEKIFVKSNTTVTKTIKVEDEVGNLLTSFSAPLIANKLHTIEANFALFGTQSYVVMDNSDLSTYKTNCRKNSECCSGDATTRPNKLFSVKGWDGSNCSGDGNSYGIAVRGGLRCDISSLMCFILPYIKQAVLYQSGIEILNEMLASDRLNCVTIYSKEWATEKIPEWEFRVEDILNSTIPTLLQTLKERDKHCVNCISRGAKVFSNVAPKYGTKEYYKYLQKYKNPPTNRNSSY
jgi:hypothetical protein